MPIIPRPGELSPQELADLNRIRPFVGRVIRVRNSSGSPLDLVFTGAYVKNQFGIDGRFNLMAYYRHPNDTMTWNAPLSGVRLDRIRDTPWE